MLLSNICGASSDAPVTSVYWASLGQSSSYLAPTLRPASMLLIFKNKEMAVTNPTPKSLMKNVDFTECFCTNSEEKFKLHIIHQHFLKILSKYFFLFPKNSISLWPFLKSSSSAASPFFCLHHCSLNTRFFSTCATEASTTLLLFYISMFFLFFNPFLM